MFVFINVSVLLMDLLLRDRGADLIQYTIVFVALFTFLRLVIVTKS